MSLREAPPAQALYDDAPCGLLLTAEDGTLLRANRTFCRWIGFEADALVGRRRFQDLLAIGGRIFHQTHFAPLLQMQGSVSEVKLEMVLAGGERMPVVVNAVRRTHGDALFDEIAVFVAKDRHAYERELMLARRRAEELAKQQLEAQEELRRLDRRKDEFLAMLAHELRNPLAPISTATHLMRLADGDPDRLRPLGEMIARQAGHLTHLIDDLLDVSRVTRGLVRLERERLELADIVEAAIEQARPLVEARGHRLDVRATPGIGVDGDRTRLVQVVVNLVNNAAKYTPPGGYIEVDAGVRDGVAEIRVSDNGLGIDAALLPHVFELFTQAERTPDRTQGGLGIGLSLVRSLVALHGGEVRAHSDGLDRGSCFTVTLPRVEPADALPRKADASPGAAPRPMRLLLVDDNEDAARTLAELLELFGHRTEVALTPEQALASTGEFDACLLDIGLPGMTGYELAALLRERGHADAMYVALTGYGQPQDRVQSEAAGFDHHLVKPVDPAKLLDALAGARAPMVDGVA